MALETQVGQLVTATTALQATVSSELTKVRAENAAFQATVIKGLNSSADSSFVLFDGTTGRQIKPGNASLDAQGNASFNGVAVANKGGNNCFLLNSNNVPVAANTTGIHNTIIGSQGNFNNNTTGAYNVGVGLALSANTTGTQNTAVGVLTLVSNTTGVSNVAIGNYASRYGTTGYGNTAVGFLSLTNNIVGNYNTGLGYGALNQDGIVNCTGIGYNALVTGNNQVQIGDANTTVYCYNAVQSRSDQRDKADVRPTTLGLDFVKALRPVDYRWDMRDAYRTPMPDPVLPDAPESERLAYDAAIAEWKESVKFENLKPNGTKKKNRFHHGLIAQEVEALIKSTGKDFGGFQDHKRSGGQDVLSIGYDELIAPLIKAVQELAQMNEELRARISTLESTKA